MAGEFHPVGGSTVPLHSTPVQILLIAPVDRRYIRDPDDARLVCQPTHQPAVVGHLDTLLVAVPGHLDDAHHRPKHLLSRDRHVGCDAGKDLDETVEAEAQNATGTRPSISGRLFDGCRNLHQATHTLKPANVFLSLRLIGRHRIAPSA